MTDSTRHYDLIVIGSGPAGQRAALQAAQSLGATIDYFADTVFNYPTLAEGYKIAAFNGINRLKGLKNGPSGHYAG